MKDDLLEQLLTWGESSGKEGARITGVIGCCHS